MLRHIVQDHSIFNERDYEALHRHVFREGYAGYKPTVKEIPNGDGKVDAEKRFAHVAPKYFTPGDEAEAKFLGMYLEEAHSVALQVAKALRLPKPFWPRIEYGALRILDYPPGAVSNKHEDFDLFTLMCFRDDVSCFKADCVEDFDTMLTLSAARRYNGGLHFGQLGEAIGIAKATPHEVIASEQRQRSIVYFAIPDHKIFLPYGTTGDVHGAITVRDWLNSRMARSRTSFQPYS
jgi:isopenicillin N synthase-like dioxygenase